VALVAVTSTRGEKSIVGEARYVVVDDGGRAEIALVVADEWQSLGIGKELFQILERIAVANGITRFAGEAFSWNEGIRRFVRASGFETWSDQDPSYFRFEKDIG
jgi:acetyltransferase